MAVATPQVKPTYRRSDVQAMLTCPAYQRAGGERAAFGTVVHAFMAAYWQRCRATGMEEKLEDVRRIARYAFFRRARGIDPGRWPEALALCERFAQNRLARLGTLLDVERTLVVDAGWCFITGTMDRLDRIDGLDPFDDMIEVQVTDYKTQWYPNWHAFQMWFYACMVVLTWPTVEWVETVADHPRVSDARGLVRERHHRSELLEWWGEIMAVFRARTESPRRDPVGGAACQYCAVRHTCPEAIVPGALVPENDQQAVELCREWIRLEHGLDARKAALRTYLADRLPVLVDDEAFGFHESGESFRVTDVPAAVSILTILGFEQAPEWVKMETRPIKANTKRLLVENGVAEFYRGGRVTFDHRKASPPEPGEEE